MGCGQACACICKCAAVGRHVHAYKSAAMGRHILISNDSQVACALAVECQRPVHVHGHD